MCRFSIYNQQLTFVVAERGRISAIGIAKKPERADSVLPQSRHIRLRRAIHGVPSFGRVGFDLIVLTGLRAVGLVACHWWAGQAETVGEVRHEA
jgi:hypothetical protein